MNLQEVTCINKPGPEVIKLFSILTAREISAAHKTEMLKDFSCF